MAPARVAGVGREDLIAAFAKQSGRLPQPGVASLASGDGEPARGVLWRLRPSCGRSLARRVRTIQIGLISPSRAHERISHLPKAVQTRIASTISATSCTRTTRAPRRHASSEAATVAAARSDTGLPVIEPRNPFRETPTRIAHPSVGKSLEVPQYLEIVLGGLAKADSRVDGDPLARDAAGLGPLDATGQEVIDLGHDVGIVRVGLHGGGGALHVHEDDPGPEARRDVGHLGIGGERADVVDDRGAGGQGRPGRLRPWWCQSRSESRV